MMSFEPYVNSTTEVSLLWDFSADGHWWTGEHVRDLLGGERFILARDDVVVTEGTLVRDSLRERG